LVGFNVFSTNIYASAAYSFRAFNDTCEGSRAPYIYQPGLDVFKSDGGAPNVRWGDYSASAVDPLNDADFWTIQEYALTNRLDDIGDPYSVWGTRWAQVRVDVPVNDNFSAAYSISGAQSSTNGNNIRATKEAGEPNHAGIVDSVSVWYRWTAPTNGNVLLSVSSDFDNALAVYTGTNVASLTLVASNHGGFNTGFKSQVVFNALAGTVYQIAVDGFGQSPNNQGSFTLQWAQPMVPLFTVQPRNWDIYMGSNITFSAQAIGSPDPSFQWAVQRNEHIRRRRVQLHQEQCPDQRHRRLHAGGYEHFRFSHERSFRTWRCTARNGRSSRNPATAPPTTTRALS